MELKEPEDNNHQSTVKPYSIREAFHAENLKIFRLKALYIKAINNKRTVK